MPPSKRILTGKATPKPDTHTKDKRLVPSKTPGKRKPRKGVVSKTARSLRRCGAYEVTLGGPCRAYRHLDLNGRCPKHRGVLSTDQTPLPTIRKKEMEEANGGSIIRNIYASGMTEEEKTLCPEITKSLGSLDDEIIMLRLRLRRLYYLERNYTKARAEYDANINNPERWIDIAVKYHFMDVDRFEIERGTGVVKCTPEEERHLQDVAQQRITWKVRDYSAEIERLTKLIGLVEVQRKELNDSANGATDSGTIRAIADDLRKFFDNATVKFAGSVQMGSGNYPDLKKSENTTTLMIESDNSGDE
jgi:hypothetical protein